CYYLFILEPSIQKGKMVLPMRKRHIAVVLPQLFLLCFFICKPACLIQAQEEPPSGREELFEQQRELALRFSERGDFLAAKQAIERALQLDPEWSEGWRKLGITEKALGHREKGIKAIAIALELNPTNPVDHYS